MDTQQVRDPQALRALAHPLRLRLLSALRAYGPATATALAGRLGESSGATSYHLRQLARWGFVVEDGGGTGRERPWRAAHAMTSWNVTDFDDPVGQAASDWMVRRQVETLAGHVARWLDADRTAPAAWRSATDVSDYRLELTASRLRSLRDELHAVVERYAGRPGGRGSRPVVVGLVAVPVTAEEP